MPHSTVVWELARDSDTPVETSLPGREAEGDREVKPDRRLRFAATERNREPILDVLKRVLPARGTVLEVASGSGEHAVYFGAALPTLQWQTSDPSEEHRESIAAWVTSARLKNVRMPLPLDACELPWPVSESDAVVCINMVHIAPFEACLGLLDGARVVLPPGGPLVLYGPFKRGGAHTAQSNADFDAGLRERNPSWGVRDLDEVVFEARRRHLTLDQVIEMPANNLSVIFRRAQDERPTDENE